ncbi:ATPase family AAA domain-containing protein 2-like isoform X2 [Macrosteles quadrilineatus]|uniref:ATPase family AAA domain-containing protein 2-like isoform X2 n=1 Tax=Macrosteles quadrilineatus TaxID=74068 RepID=UPI0023E0BBE6|nr:ATPase family AAA domain-containing protein 2-like isoform X2 [Macrosteles quadrilineatus]
MVRKRSNVDTESKMPVKNSHKDKSEVSRDVESLSLSDKDNSDFSAKGTKLYSRELRNRFVIASKKRSLRFTNEVNPGRHMRSCRMAITNRQHYTLSQSDDDDDHIFAARSSRRLRHPKRRLSSPEPPAESEMHTPAPKRVRSSSTVNGHSSKSPPDEEEVPEEDAAGIRRSTRQRKLKYENYSDSWIVGAQTLRGYPQNNYDEDLREVYRSTPYPTRQLKKIKCEQVEGDEEEEEEEEEDMKAAGEDTEEGDTEDGGNAARNMVAERKSERRRNCNKAVEQDGEEEQQHDGEQNDVGIEEMDMYSRVKRKRTRRSIYDSTLLNRRRNEERKCIQRQDNSTEESDTSSEDEPPSRGRNRERVQKRKYHLRETKPTVKRFQITHVEEPRRKSSRTIRAVLCETMRRRHRRSSSTSSSSSDDRGRFDRKKPKSSKSRSRLLAGAEADAKRGKPEASGRLADVDPVSLDTSIRFSHVGGLEEHVRCLQEMVVFPMLYAEIFQKYHVTPPKGVLFHGPPGTGKTLIARALANECSLGDRKVTFFMRKGADCLSKWVGESERQLRLLFEEAHQAKPSIIFFDEIDGLAPVRSAKQDQIHASIVSTLLALMDGLDDRGEIVVIGATNRIDAIDPALRRPGRFDRELLFPLPGNRERQEILKIHMSKWEKPPAPNVISHLAEKAVGYCGSDLRALCSEAVIQALRRRYPQIYKSNRKLLLDPDNVKVEKCDFEVAQRGIVPASHRVAPGTGRKLPKYLEPLLGESVTMLATLVKNIFQPGFVKASKSMRMVKSPRLLVLGQRKATLLTTAALLLRMEGCPVFTMDLATIYSESSRSPEEAIVQLLNEVRRNIPSILYVPGIAEFWKTVGPAVRAIFKSLLSQLDPTLPIFLLATAVNQVPDELRPMFSAYRNEIFTIKPPTAKQKEEFFRPLLLQRALLRPPPEKKKEPLEELPEAPPPPPPKLSQPELRKLYAKEEHKLRELRIFLRQICNKLARNKQFFMFSRPVDINEVPDYLTIIKEPMDLETMMTKIDLHKYNCAQDFLNDVELICRNALEYNPDRDPADKLIRHRACYLRDTAYALIKAEMDSDFEDMCREIRKSRVERGAIVDEFAPEFIQTAAMVEQQKRLGSEGNNHQSSAANNSNAVSTEANTTSQTGSATTKKSLTKRSLIHDRKRKKNSLWSRGIANKSARKPKLSQTSTSPSDSKSKSQKEEVGASSMDDTINSELDSQAHSTPIKGGRRSLSDAAGTEENDEEQDMMVNGIEGSSSEEEEEEGGEDRLGSGKESGSNHNEPNSTTDNHSPSSKQNKGGGKTLVINKSALTRLLHEAVNVTQHVHSLEVHIDLYAQLRQVISRYHRLWNRSKLPQEIEAELKRFASENKEEVLDHDETFNTSREDASVL